MNLHGTNVLAVVLSLVLVASAQGVALDPFMIDLTGGVGGQSGQTVYTAPNGTVVTAQGPVWVNTDFYYMDNLFDEDLTSDVHDFWLTQLATFPQTLTFAFDQDYIMEKIRVYPFSGSARHSDYQILVSSNGGSITTDITGGYVDTSSDALNSFHDHTVDNLINWVQFSLLQSPGIGGVSLNEIQFFAFPPVPEPSSLCLLGLGALGLVRYTRRRRARA